MTSSSDWTAEDGRDFAGSNLELAERALQKLLRLFGGGIRIIFERAEPGIVDAEGGVQEVFHRMWNARSRIKIDMDPRKYIYTIASNYLSDQKKKSLGPNLINVTKKTKSVLATLSRQDASIIYDRIYGRQVKHEDVERVVNKLDSETRELLLAVISRSDQKRNENHARQQENSCLSLSESFRQLLDDNESLGGDDRAAIDSALFRGEFDHCKFNNAIKCLDEECVKPFKKWIEETLSLWDCADDDLDRLLIHHLKFCNGNGVAALADAIVNGSEPELERDLFERARAVIRNKSRPSTHPLVLKLDINKVAAVLRKRKERLSKTHKERQARRMAKNKTEVANEG